MTEGIVAAYRKGIVRLEIDKAEAIPAALCTSHPDCKCHFCTVTRLEPVSYQVLYSAPYGYRRYTHAELAEASRERYLQLKALPYSIELLERKEWELYVLNFQRICQIEAFAEVAQHLDDKMYWHLLGHIFCRAANFGIYHDLYLSVLRAPRPHHHYFHTVAQQQGWDSLSQKVTIYRGHGPDNKYGIWYTLNVGIAFEYAQRHKRGRSHVFSCQVNKRDLLYGGNNVPIGIHEDAVFFVQGLGDIQASLT